MAPFINGKDRKAFFLRQKKTGRSSRARQQSSCNGSHHLNQAQPMPQVQPTPMYPEQPMPHVQPTPQPWTIPSMAPPPFQFQQITLDPRFIQFQQFQAQWQTMSYQQYERFLSMTGPQNTQPANFMSMYPQNQPQHTSPYHQPVQPVQYQFTPSPNHQFGPGPYSQECHPNMPSTGCCVGHNASAPCCSGNTISTTPGSAPKVEIPQKRKSATSDPEDTEPKRPRQATSVDKSHSTVDPQSAAPNKQDFNMSSSTKFMGESLHSDTNRPASSNSTVEGSAAHSFKCQSAPPAHLSTENVNTIALECSLKLAESKIDSPGFEHGVLLDKNVVFIKGDFADFRPSEWYSWQTIAAWRASVAIPSNWIVRVPGETLTRVPISRKITDVIGVNHEEKRCHWTLVHLSIKKWTVTYYDSYLGASTDDVCNMTLSCNQLIGTVRDGYTKSGITLPSEDPPMTAECTIAQRDSHSCGPFAVREAEKLMGFSVDEDQECPVAIRCRHLHSIYKAICKHIDAFSLLLPSTEDDANDLEEITPVNAQTPTDIVRLKTTTQAAITVSKITPPQKREAIVPKPRSKSQATTECSTPSNGYNTLVHNNPFVPQSLFSDTPRVSPDDSMMDNPDTPPDLPAMAKRDTSEEPASQEPKVVADQTYYKRKIASMIAKGSTYLTTEVKPDHMFRLNGQTVDLPTLRHFEPDQPYNNEVMGLLIATSGHRDDWACVLHDVESRRLPRTVKNVLYFVDREQWWFLAHVNLDEDLLTHYTTAGHDNELDKKSIKEIIQLYRRKKKKGMTVHEVEFDAAAHLTVTAVTSHDSGVMTWCQAEMLLGLVGPTQAQSISEARLRHVSQVVREMYAKSVPRRRSRSKTYTGMMPTDDSDSPDESGDFEAFTSSTDTPQSISTGNPDEHARDLTSS